MPTYKAILNIELEINADDKNQAVECADEYIYNHSIELEPLGWEITEIKDKETD